MAKDYLDQTGLTYFWGKIKAYVANAVKVTGVKGNSESSYRTGNVNLTAANVGAVATSGNETVAGNKTFSGTTSLTAGSIYPVSMGTAISSNAAAIIQSPFPKYLWHDVWAFCRDKTPTYYTTEDGTTWTEATLNKNLFLHKMAWGRQNVIDATIKGSRWVWETNAWSYSSAAWLLIGISYSATNAYFDITLESADSNGNWTTLLTKENCYYNSTPVWIKTNNPASTAQIRLTILRNANDATTNILPVTSLRWLASRWGDQGRGEELEYPYQWNDTNSIYPISNNTSTLGTSSYKWSNVYSTTFTGNLTGNVSGYATSLASETGRPTSANDLHDNTKRVRAFLASNSMTTAKPPHDAHMLHFNWDNGTASTGTWDSQLAINNSEAKIYVRSQNNGTWTDWQTVYATNNKPTKSDVGLGNVDNTADANKSVAYAANSGTVNNHTVNSDVPANAVFTDTTYSLATASADGLMSSTDFSKLSGIATGATKNLASATNPLMDGTASAGVSSDYAKGDHRHPTDTTRAPLASPAFTGTPTAPTAAVGTNTTQIATTAFVKNAIDNITGTANTKTIIINNFSVSSSDWMSSPETDYPYMAFLHGTTELNGVTANDYAEVIFSLSKATSGNYAPICETDSLGIWIYSKVNTAVTIPTIIITQIV